jgi:hypothetical protein
MALYYRWEQIQGADGRPILTEWGEAIVGYGEAQIEGPYLRWKQLLDEDGRPLLDEEGEALVGYGEAYLEGTPQDAGTRKRCPFCQRAGERCVVCGGTSWLTM